MSIFSAQKIYLMGLNRSPLVNVFSSKILASVAGGACALRAARARQAGAWLGAWERGWEREFLHTSSEIFIIGSVTGA